MTWGRIGKPYPNPPAFHRSAIPDLVSDDLDRYRERRRKAFVVRNLPISLPFRFGDRSAKDPRHADHRELESEPRYIYTGAIGYITPERDFYFNIPIRTLLIRGSVGEMG